MNIIQMHTAIDVGVNHLNSQLYRKITNSVKDIIINSCIDESIDTIANLKPLMTRSDLARLPNVDFNDANFDTFEMPWYYTGQITDGLIRHQTKYYIVDPGSTNWSGIFEGTVIAGEIKTSNLTELNSATTDIILVEGLTYKIVDKGSYDWSELGYDITTIRNGVTIKIANALTIPDGSGVILQPLTVYPTDGWNASTLYVVDDHNVLTTQRLSATVSSREINKGVVEPNTYIIVNKEDGDDLTVIGATSTMLVGDTFNCTITKVVNFTHGSKVAAIRTVPCTILNTTTLGAMDLDTNISSSVIPIATIEDDNLKVYHNNSFKVLSVMLDYIRIPRRVKYEYEISCDLFQLAHEPIVAKSIVKTIVYAKGMAAQSQQAQPQNQQQ